MLDYRFDTGALATGVTGRVSRNENVIGSRESVTSWSSIGTEDQEKGKEPSQAFG